VQPGIFIENCLVQSKNRICNIINIINITHVEIQVPCVTPIEIASEDICESSIQKEEEEEEIKTVILKTICIENTLK